MTSPAGSACGAAFGAGWVAMYSISAVPVGAERRAAVIPVDLLIPVNFRLGHVIILNESLLT
jgi:hypothetical protein